MGGKSQPLSNLVHGCLETDSHRWRSGQRGGKTLSPEPGSEEVVTHLHTGTEISPWRSWSVCCVHVRLTTDAGTRTRGFSRPCSQTLSPSPGSSVQSGHWIPDWQASLKAGAHWMTSDLTVGGTNKRWGGQALGPGCPSVPNLICSSTSYVKTATPQGIWRMEFPVADIIPFCGGQASWEKGAKVGPLVGGHPLW